MQRLMPLEGHSFSCHRYSTNTSLTAGVAARLTWDEEGALSVASYRLMPAPATQNYTQVWEPVWSILLPPNSLGMLR